MRCLVLGGGGFIGSAVTDRLLQANHKVRVLARPDVSPYRRFGVDEPVDWCRGDFLNILDLRRVVQGVDVVVHLVSSTVPKSADDDPLWDAQSNLVGSLQLFQVIRESPVRRVIFISSGGTVYGEPRYLPIDEDHPTNPVSAYGVTKLAIEKHLEIMTRLYGVSSLILRVGNAYGQRQRSGASYGAIGVFIQRAIAGAPIEIWGDGTTTRDYVHVDDVAEAFAQAVSYDGSERIFNVGTGLGTSLNDLLDLLENVIGRPLHRVYRPGRAFDVPKSVLDISRIRAAFGWTPRIGIREGLIRTLAQLRRLDG